jgi:hypothetical protein
MASRLATSIRSAARACVGYGAVQADAVGQSVGQYQGCVRSACFVACLRSVVDAGTGGRTTASGQDFNDILFKAVEAKKAAATKV